MKWKKIGLLLLVWTLCGCAGKQQEAAENPAELTLCEQHAADAVTLDWYVNYSWFATPWGENAVSKKITEDTGISVHFLTPKGNEKEKFNAMISADVRSFSRWPLNTSPITLLSIAYTFLQ